VEWRSSPGCDARSEARTQGAPIAAAIGATEDAASGRAARPGGSAAIPPSPPSWASRTRARHRRRSRSRPRSSPRRGTPASHAPRPRTASRTRRTRARTSPDSETPVPQSPRGLADRRNLSARPGRRQAASPQFPHDFSDAPTPLTLWPPGVSGDGRNAGECSLCEHSLRSNQYGTRSCRMQRCP
jgi:hypothetical protein